MRTVIFNIVTLFFALQVHGQLITTPMPAASLVQNVLLGNGVTVSNINYNGSAMAIGSFTAFGTNLGISEGVVMTTGTIQAGGSGPQGPNNDPGSGLDNGTPGFAPLTNIVGTQTYNASILQFDFVPYSDTVSFRYVFGSEEYPEYVGSQFNDVFAFFISGPGIAGSQNIAKLPNGQPVTINNVNAGSNSAFYVYNGTGSNSPYNSSQMYIQYDGFTKVLTATSQVQCGQTYHLTIAIADVGDGILDSGIFLEANSLTSKTPVEIEYEITPQLFTNPDVMAEACSQTTVTLTRGPNNIGSALTIPVNVSGSATEGIDYDNIPNTVTFPAGVSQIQFTFSALLDALVEGQESVILSFPLTDPCGNVTPVNITVYIQDVQPVDVDVTGGTIQCPGEEVTLTATPSGGAAPYTILWSTTETSPTITVAPLTTTTYTVSVTDACLNQTATASYEVVVPVVPPLVVSATPTITEICPYIPATLESFVSGGSGSYTYAWATATGGVIATTPTVNVIPAQTTTYLLTVQDNCGNVESTSVLYTIISPPLIPNMNPPVEICPGDSVQIFANPSGGYGDYYYFWTHSGETTSSVWVNPNSTTPYSVIISDECQTFTVIGTTGVIVVKPTADFYTTNTEFFNNMPVTFINSSVNAVAYEWDFGDGNTSDFVHPSNTYIDPGTYYITLVAIDEKGCTDTIVKPIGIEEEWYIYVPNTFTPDGDRHNNDFRITTVGIKQLEIAVFNRWGEVVFTSNELDFIWDGTYLGTYINDGTYTWKIRFLTNSGRDRTITGHVNMLK